jgi:hypothetical protein
LVKVPNKKVVPHILISLHAKFHIFLRSLSNFSIQLSPIALFNWKKNLKWKNLHALPPPQPAYFYSTPGPTHFSKPARAVSSPGSLLTGPSASHTPRVSLTHSRAGTVMQPTQYRAHYRSQTRPLPLLRLHAAHRHDSDRPITLMPCLSTTSLLRCLVPSRTEAFPRAAATPALPLCSQGTIAAPEAEDSPTNHGHNRTLMRFLGCRYLPHCIASRRCAFRLAAPSLMAPSAKQCSSLPT